MTHTAREAPMRPEKKRQKRSPNFRDQYYGVLFLCLTGSFAATLAVLGIPLLVMDTRDPSYIPGMALLVFLAALTVMLVSSLWLRWLPARQADLPTEVVHEALTPERSLIFSFCLVTAVANLNFAVAFNDAVLGILASAVVLGPLVTYAKHAGQLRILLERGPTANPTDVGKLQQHNENLQSELDTLKERLAAMERAGVWHRLTRQYPQPQEHT